MPESHPVLPVTKTSKASAGPSNRCFNWYLAEANSSKANPTAFIVKYASHAFNSGQVYILKEYFQLLIK